MATYGFNGAGYGYVPDTRDITVIARGGNISAGRCYPLALGSANQITADGVTLSTTPGDPGFPYSNAVGAGIGSTDRRNGIFVIALEDGVDGQPFRGRLKGLVRAYVVDSANSAITIGKEFVPGSAGTTQLDASSTSYTGGGNTVRKAIARALEAYSSTPSDGTTILVDFNGEEGIGFGNVA